MLNKIKKILDEKILVNKIFYYLIVINLIVDFIINFKKTFLK